MKDEKVEALRLQMASSYKELRNTIKKLDHACQVKNLLEQKLVKQRQRYESLDRELAMIDGRYTVCKSETKTQTKIKMSRADVLAIAKALGIDVSFND